MSILASHARICLFGLSQPLTASPRPVVGINVDQVCSSLDLYNVESSTEFEI
jgi:hypothetical protein